MVAFRAAGSSGSDVTPPTAPGSLAAAAVSNSQIDLAWTASTDDVGVTDYLIESCQGSGCSSFVQIALTPTTNYSHMGLGVSTSHSYRVRATDAAGNLGSYSNTASATTPAPTGPSGLVAAYGFDEGSGSSVTDASGNGNTGSVSGATWVAAGKFGKALQFNGTSARVNVPDSASLHLTTGMTLEAWVDPSTVNGNWRDVIYKGNDNYYLEATSTNGSRPDGGLIAGGSYADAYGTAALPANSWSYLAETYDGSNVRLYVNGTLVATTAHTGSISTSTNQLQIGGDSIYGQYFAGMIDEVRIYNTALTAAQIQSDQTTPINPTGPDTQPPTQPGTLSASAVSAGEVDLSWGASTDNVGVTGYLVERCSGAACSNFAQVGTTSGATTYKDTTVSAGTAYSYRVRATDAAGNLSPYTNTATATTPTATYSIGGSVSGLSGSVVLQNNGGGDLTVSTNGPFTFAAQLTGGATYAVTVKTNPSGQTCSVSNGSGTVGSTNVTNVAVTCVTTPTYSVGGSVSGLSGTVVLQDNGGDDLSVTATGSFVFATKLVSGAAYVVTVETNPSGQTCSVSNGSGTVAATNVTNVTVTCSTSSSTATDDFNRADGGLGPNWTAVADGGLSISSQAVLGSSATAGDIRTGESYASDQSSQVQLTSAQLSGGQWVGPAVRMQNGGQNQYLGIYFWNSGTQELRLYKRSAGTWVQLGSSYSSGPLTAGTQLQVTAVGSTISFLQNGVTRISVTDTSFTGGAPGIMTFGAAQADSWVGTGVTGSAPPPTTYSVGGSVSGLSGSLVLQDNGGDDLAVSANGPFTFATQLASGSAFAVTVKTNPSGQTCSVSNGSGTVGVANVTSVLVTCGTGNPAFQVSYQGTANGIASYQVTSPDDGPDPQVLRVLAPTNPAPGVPHNFLYVLPVEAGLGSNYGDGLATLQALDAEDQYNLTVIEPSFELEPWYADNPIDGNTQYETFMTRDLVPWITQNLSTSGHEQNWLIGFSKSGIGGEDLILKHPDIFSLAASWDFPADMNAYDQFGSSSANEYGTDANFQANYRLTQAFVDAHKAPFLTSNRIWIGGYSAFQTDMSDYDALLTSEGILHTTETPTLIAHRWDSGWVPIALAALHQDSGNLPAAQ
jgi:hypothetical protein